MPAQERFRCFTRNWWKSNPSWPDGREPGPGPKRYKRNAVNMTESEARAYCRAWNDSHERGPLSNKCEYESY